jgi:NAD(P)H-dependent FMN reductase
MPGIQSRLIDLAEYSIPQLEHVIARHPEPPTSLVQIGEWLEASDVIFFVSPEYNGSYTSALKALVDHFPKSTYAKKPIGVVTVSSGAMGGMRAAQQLQHLILALSAFPVPQMLLVGKVADQLDAEGKALNERFPAQAKQFLDSVLWLGEAVQAKKHSVVMSN